MLLIITKKAFLLSKIALVLIGILGWNTGWTNIGHQSGHLQGGFYGHSHSIYPYHTESHYPSQYGYRRYNRLQNLGYSPYNQHVIREIVNVHENDRMEPEDKKTKRKIMWTKES